MGSFSLLHWLIVLFVVLLLFGSRRLPNLMTDLASAVRAFRKGLGEEGEVESSPQAQSAAPKQLTNVTPSDAAVLEVQAVADPVKKVVAKPAKKPAAKVVAKPVAKSLATSASKPAAKAKPAATTAAAAAKKPASARSKAVKES
ncbi:MAG: twin-arginine translocase TatA/TatE family subunit [Alphaproteobacteria bacterium]|nr:twin-arginine translocase TatA/TatE family subunit [Alphaproteobacteria bacterium]